MRAFRLKPTSGVLLWDIDGTLIRTKRAKTASPHKDVLRRGGFFFDEAKIGLSGFTDYEVLLELVNNPDQLSETEFKQIFHDLDEESRNLDKSSTFDLYPGVKAVLESLTSLGWIHGILTGNTNARMVAKLQLAGIADYFADEFLFSCSFGDSRDDITRNARAKLNAKKHTSVLILGDTPKDIAAARISNFPIISVATGSYSTTDLSSHNPDLLIRNLADDAVMLLEFLRVFPR